LLLVGGTKNFGGVGTLSLGIGVVFYTLKRLPHMSTWSQNIWGCSAHPFGCAALMTPGNSPSTCYHAKLGRSG